MATDVAQLAVTLSVRDQATPAIQQLLDLLRQGINVGGSFSSTMASSAGTASQAWQAATQASQQAMSAVAAGNTANAAAAQSLNQVGQAATGATQATHAHAQATAAGTQATTAATAAHASLGNQVNQNTAALGGHTRAWISLGSAVSSLPGPLGAIGSAFGAIHMSISPLNAAILGIGAAMASASAVLASGFATSIDEARQFQRTMAEVQVVTNATAEQMNAMTQAALQIGVTTQFNSQMAAKGLYELGSAGLTVKEALTALPQVTNAAMLGNRNLGDTTKDVVAGLRQFGLEASQTGHVVDVMTTAVQGSVLHWSEVGSLWANLRGRATQLSLGMEDIVAAEMLMVNAGIPAAAASSAIGTAVDRLSKQTGEAAKGLAELGVHAFNSEGEFVGLLNIYQQLEARMPEMTQQQQAHAMSLLGGSRAAGAFSAVLTQQQSVLTENGDEVKRGADLYAYWVNQLKNADGAAQHAKEVIEQTLDYQLKVLNGSIQEAGVQIGRTFLPALQSIVPVATQAVNAFLQMPEVLRTTTVVMAAAATGALSVASALQIWTVVGPVIVPMLGTIAAALGTIAVPIGLVIAASAALSIAWQTDFLNIQEHTHDATNAVGSYLSDLRTDIDLTAQYIGKIQLPKLGSAAAATADELGLGGIGQLFSDIGDTANKLAAAAGTDAGKLFKLGLVTELAMMGPVGAALATVFGLDALKQALDAARPGIQAALDAAISPEEAADRAAGTLDKMAMGAVAKIKEGASLESAATAAMWDQVTAAWKDGVDKTGDMTQENLDLVIARVTELSKKGGAGIGHALASSIAGSGDAVKDAIEALLEETGSVPKAINAAIQSGNQLAATGLMQMATQHKVVATAIEGSTAAYRAQVEIIEYTKGPLAALNQVYSDGHITLPQYNAAMAGIVLTTKEEASAANTAEAALKKMHDAMTPGQKVFEQQAQSVLSQLNQGVSIDVKAKLADYGQGKTAQDQLAGILGAAGAPGITLTDLYYGSPQQNQEKIALLAAALQGGGAAKLLPAVQDTGKKMGQALASGVEEAAPAVAKAAEDLNAAAGKALAGGAATVAQGWSTALRAGVSEQDAQAIGQQFAADIASGMSFAKAANAMQAAITAALANVDLAPVATTAGTTYTGALATAVAQGGPELGQAGTALAAGLNTAFGEGLGEDDVATSITAFKAAVVTQLGGPNAETLAVATNLGSQLEQAVADGLSPDQAAALAVDFLNGLARSFPEEGKTAEQEMRNVGNLIFTALHDGLTPEIAAGIGSSFIQGVAKGIKESGDIGPALDESTQGGMEQVRSSWGITGTTSTRAAAEIGHPVAQGIADGIIEGTPAIEAAGASAVEKAIAAAKARGEIRSPSALMAEEVGVPLAQGIAEGFKAGMPAVETEISDSVRGIISTASRSLTEGWSDFTQDFAAKAFASTDNKSFPLDTRPPLDEFPQGPAYSPYDDPTDNQRFPQDAQIAGIGRGRGLYSLLGGGASLSQLLGGMDANIPGQGVDPTVTKAISDAVAEGTTVAYQLMQSHGGPVVGGAPPPVPPPYPQLYDAQGRLLQTPLPPPRPVDPSGAYGPLSVQPPMTTTRGGTHMVADPFGGHMVTDPTVVSTTQTFPGGQGMGGAIGRDWVPPPNFNLQEAVRLTMDRMGNSPYSARQVTDTTQASSYQINPMNSRTGMGGGISNQTSTETTQQRMETPAEIFNRTRPNLYTMENLRDPYPMRQYMGGGVGRYVDGQFVPAPDELTTSSSGITGYVSAGSAARTRAFNDPAYQAAYAAYQQQLQAYQQEQAALRAAEIESTRVYNTEVKGRQDAMLASLSEQGVDPFLLRGQSGLRNIVRQEAQQQVTPGYDPQESADRIQQYLERLADPNFGRPPLQEGMSERLAANLEANQRYLDQVASHNVAIGTQPAAVNMAYYTWTGQAAQEGAGLDIEGPRGYTGGGLGGGAPTGYGAPNIIRDPATGKIYYQFAGGQPIERGSPDATPAEMTPSLQALLDRVSGKFGYTAGGQARTQEQYEQATTQYQQSLAYSAASIRRVGDTSDSVRGRLDALGASFQSQEVNGQRLMAQQGQYLDGFGRLQTRLQDVTQQAATGPAADLTPLAGVTGQVTQAAQQMGTTMSSIVDQFTVCWDAAGKIQSVFDQTGRNVTSQFTTLSNDLQGNVQRYQNELTLAEQSTGELADLARDVHLSAAAGATSAADIAQNFQVCLDAAGNIQSVFTNTGTDITARFADLGGTLTENVKGFMDQFWSKAGASVPANVLQRLAFDNTAAGPGGGGALLPGNVNPNDYFAAGPYGQSPSGLNPYASEGPYSPFAAGPLGYASTPGNPMGWAPGAGAMAKYGIPYGSVSSQSFLDLVAKLEFQANPNAGLAVNAAGQSTADFFDQIKQIGQAGGTSPTVNVGSGLATSLAFISASGTVQQDPITGGDALAKLQADVTRNWTVAKDNAKRLADSTSLAGQAWSSIADLSKSMDSSIAHVAGAFAAMPAGGFGDATSAIAAVTAAGYKTPGLGNATVNTGGSGPAPANGGTYGAQSGFALQQLIDQLAARGIMGGDTNFQSELTKLRRSDQSYLRVVGQTTETLGDYEREVSDAQQEVSNLSNVMNQLGDAYGSGVGIAAQLAAAQARLAAATAGAATAVANTPGPAIPGYNQYNQPGGAQGPSYYTPVGSGPIANTIATAPGPNGTTLAGVNQSGGSQQAFVSIQGVLVPAGATSAESLAILAAHGIFPEMPENPRVFGEGGIAMNRQLAIVGDSGPELIIPINQLSRDAIAGPALTSVASVPQLTSTAGTRFGVEGSTLSSIGGYRGAGYAVESAIGSTGGYASNYQGSAPGSPPPPPLTPYKALGGIGVGADGVTTWNNVPIPGYQITADGIWLEKDGVRLTDQEAQILAQLKGVNLSQAQLYALLGTNPPPPGTTATTGVNATVSGTPAKNYGPVHKINSTSTSDFYQQPDGSIFQVPHGSGITQDQTGFGYGQRNLPVNLSGSSTAAAAVAGPAPAFIANPASAPAGTRMIRTDDKWDTYIQPDGTIVQVPHGSVPAVDIGGRITWGPPLPAPVGATPTPTGPFEPTHTGSTVGTPTAIGNPPSSGIPTSTVLEPTTHILPAPTFTGGVRGFADGGIAWTPQLAMLAEKGPERIMPLNAEHGGIGGSTTIGDIHITVVSQGDAVADVAEIGRKLRSEWARSGLELRRRGGF